MIHEFCEIWTFTSVSISEYKKLFLQIILITINYHAGTMQLLLLTFFHHEKIFLHGYVVLISHKKLMIEAGAMRPSNSP